MTTGSTEIHLWFWQYTDEFGKRRVSRWRMTEGDAARYKDAVKVEGSLERRVPIWEHWRPSEKRPLNVVVHGLN